MGNPQELTNILSALAAGEVGAEEKLYGLVYAELKRMAHRQMSNERPGSTLQTTALVNEAYMRLGGGRSVRWESRRHFFGAAARAMRQILVDKARAAGAGKRGGDRVRVTLSEDTPGKGRPVDVLALEEALGRLAGQSPRHVEVVRYRYYLGCTVEETAELLDRSPRTVHADWHFAKTWLRREMSERSS